jgi:hypothetical protein
MLTRLSSSPVDEIYTSVKKKLEMSAKLSGSSEFNIFTNVEELTRTSPGQVTQKYPKV